MFNEKSSSIFLCNLVLANFIIENAFCSNNWNWKGYKHLRLVEDERTAMAAASPRVPLTRHDMVEYSSTDGVKDNGVRVQQRGYEPETQKVLIRLCPPRPNCAMWRVQPSGWYAVSSHIASINAARLMKATGIIATVQCIDDIRSCIRVVVRSCCRGILASYTAWQAWPPWYLSVQRTRWHQ